MSNKFWAAGSDSDSESSASSESSSDDERQGPGGRTTGRFQMSDSSSDSEDEVRVVKSAKDRVVDALRDCVNRVNNGLKNLDWAIIEDEFANTNKKLEKSKNQLEAGTPKFYVKMLAALEDAVTETIKDKAKFKAMKPAVVRIINRMKLNVKKHNKSFEADITDYRASPEDYDTAVEDSDSDSDSDSDEDSDEESEEEDLAKKPKAMDDDASLSDDSLFKDNDLSDDSDSDDDDLFAPPPAAAPTQGEGRVLAGRARWLKKPESEKKKKDKTNKVAVPRKQGEAKTGPVAVRRVQVLEKNLTPEEVNTRLADVVASRGRKGTDPRELLRKLEMLSRQSRRHGARVEIPVVMHLISVMYDSHRVIDDYMDLNTWRTAFRCLVRVVGLLNENQEISLGMMPNEDATQVSGGSSSLMKKGDGDATDETPAEEEKTDNKNVIRVVGTLETFLSRLEGEFTKSLQQINPHTKDYLVRLADEASLIELSKFIFQYYERVGDKGSAALVALVNVEHVYYKHNIVDMAVQRAHAFTSKWGRLADVHPALTAKQVLVSDSGRDASKMHPATYQGYPQVDVEVADPADTLNELCQYIFKHGDERTKSRALLCSVFHHALHDRFHKARDLFLISHIQDVVDKVDTKTQILFNRTLATLGLSAFRAGLIQKAHDCLSGICSGRPMQVKELLAQGTSRWGPDRDPEQERLEKRRQMPYHMHINHDLLDCCYLTCAMLLELPSIAAKQYPRAGAGAFRKYFQTYSRQIFTGPPENTREHVMAASKALLEGEWQKGANYILGMDVWNLIPNEGGAKVKEMLHGRIKDEAIRTYLLSSVVSAYGSISLDHLCESFEMDGTTVKRIVSKMIFNKEMNAAWDEDTLIIQKNEVSSLQQLSVRVADKVNQLTESNERLLDPLNGGQMFGLSDQWQDNRGYRKGGQWQDDRRGGNRWAKSGASGRGEYRGNRNDGQRRHQHQHRDQHQHQHQRRDGGGGRGGHHGGDRGHGGGNGGYNREREASEKPKMAWNAVSNEAK